MWKEIVERLRSLKPAGGCHDIKPNQRVGIKLESLPNTFITRIEDVDKDNIYISAVTDKELNFSVVLPDEKLEIFVFMDEFYYKNKCVLKKKISQPLPMWVLSKPKKLAAYAERRKAFRLDNVLDASFKVSGGLLKDSSRGLTRNISIGGIAMVSTVDLPLKTGIDVTISGMGEEKTVFAGEIVWKYTRPSLDKWYYGVRFLNIGENKENVLNKYIQERLRSLRWAGLV